MLKNDKGTKTRQIISDHNTLNVSKTVCMHFSINHDEIPRQHCERREDYGSVTFEVFWNYN